jgi:hypothetical protein
MNLLVNVDVDDLQKAARSTRTLRVAETFLLVPLVPLH